MKTMLGAFASSCAQRRFGADLPAGLGAAVRHYERCLASNPLLVALPRGFDFQPEPPLVEVEADLSPACLALLEHESRRLGVARQLLLNHAVIFYLAELDRAALRRCGGRTRDRRPLGR